jgi:glutamate 5-kinase
VTDLVKAQLLIILTDMDGFYTADPRRDRDARLMPLVQNITSEFEAMAGKSSSGSGTGGMKTKLEAARRVSLFGVPTVIARGKEREIVKRLMRGEEMGTLFCPGSVKLKGKKTWLAHHLRPSGKIIIDEGAKKALIHNGKSLLPSGITAVNGEFKFGDLVSCRDQKGREVARGLTNYDSRDLMKIRGHRTTDIEDILGYKNYDEVIHRDHLVISVDKL